MAGTLDTTFGTNGGWTPSPFYNNYQPTLDYSSAMDNSGRIFVTGQIINNTNGVQSLFVARYTSNGILDTTFGEDSKGWTATTFISGKDCVGFSIALDSTGKIVVTGNTFDTDNTQKTLVARYTSSGILDTTFGEGSKGWTATTFISGKDCVGFSLVLDSTGKIVVTGYTFDTDNTSRLLLARYTSSGVLDTTFGEDSKGWTATTFISGKSSSGVSIALDSTGKIVVTGDTYDTNTSRILVARYTTSGILDTTFGEGSKGWTATTFISGISSSGNSIALDNTGKIVVAGFTLDTTDNTTKLLVARYTTSGILDTTFGEGSKGWTLFPGLAQYLTINSIPVVIDSNNRIVVSGNTYIDDTQKTLVARYTTSGILDTTFGEDSKGWTETTFISGQYSGGSSIVLDSTGRIVVVGYTGSSTDVYKLLVFVARYLGDPIPTTTTTTTTTEPICLPAGTPIVTDQGLVNIELIDPKKHTIGHKRIVAITKTITPEKHLICFEKYTLGLNIPTKRTMMTPGHEVLYNGKLVQAKHFLGRLDGVHAVPYKGEVLYNVLQEKHGLMVVNNMVLETLHPENKVAKEILEKDRH